jgi:protein-tyrosine phosphatase
LGITRAFDLRTAAERSHRPVNLPTATRVHLVDLLSGEPEGGPASLGRIARAAGSATGPDLSREELRLAFLHSYRSFVTLPSAKEHTAALLSSLADSADQPALVHCTAGKDRTGWISALVLLTLGVDVDDVMSDYLASGPQVAQMFAPYRDMLLQEGRDVAPLDFALGVYPEYLEASLASLRETHGSVPKFLHEGLGLPADMPERLQAALLTTTHPGRNGPTPVDDER